MAGGMESTQVQEANNNRNKNKSTPLFSKLGNVIRKLFGRGKNGKGTTEAVDPANSKAGMGEERDSEAAYSTTTKNTDSPSKSETKGPSFKQAFAQARKDKGPGGTFTWNGKSYSTNRADDVKPKASSPSNAAGNPTDNTPGNEKYGPPAPGNEKYGPPAPKPNPLAHMMLDDESEVTPKVRGVSEPKIKNTLTQRKKLVQPDPNKNRIYRSGGSSSTNKGRNIYNNG